MASAHVDDEPDQLIEESDSDTEVAPPPKKLLASPGSDGEGKGFGAVKPWVGAIAPPTAAGSVDTSAPAHNLTLEHVFGYRAFDSKSNIVVNTHGQIIYPVAGLIVLRAPNGEQTYFRGHTDDVRCLAQSPADQNWMVSGQNATVVNGRATAPHVCVWNSHDLSQSHTLNLPVGTRAVRAVAFSPCGKYVSAVANDDDHSIFIFDWAKNKLILTQPLAKDAIFQIKWNHARPSATSYELCTVGTKHCYFHSFETSPAPTLKSKRVLLGKISSIQTWNTMTWTENGNAIIGGFDGTLLVCTNGAAVKCVPVSSVKDAKKAPKVFSLDTYHGGIVAGLSDKTAVVLSSKLAIEKTLTFPHKVTTVRVHGRDLIVGTQGSEVYQIPGALDAGVASGPIAGRFEPLTSGHFDGETWALAMMKDGKHCVTAGEDNTICLWDVESHRLVRRAPILPPGAKVGKAPVVKKASTMSLHPQNQCARAVAVSPDQSRIVVATNDGNINIYDGQSLAFIASADLNATGQRQVTNQEGNWTQTIEFNLQGTLLAVGTHGSVIVILDAAHDYQILSVIKSHHSFLTHMDWSQDGTLLRSNDGAYELLVHNLSDPRHPQQVTSTAATRDVAWASHHCLFSYACVGTLQSSAGHLINSVASNNPSSTLLVTGDDFGRVNLFRFPAPAPGHRFVAHRGHSSHVTCVRFSADGKYVVSTGGYDKGVFVWRVDEFREDPTGLAHIVQ